MLQFLISSSRHRQPRVPRAVAARRLMLQFRGSVVTSDAVERDGGQDARRCAHPTNAPYALLGQRILYCLFYSVLSRFKQAKLRLAYLTARLVSPESAY
jgi:hypothetical protein